MIKIVSQHLYSTVSKINFIAFLPKIFVVNCKLEF